MLERAHLVAHDWFWLDQFDLFSHDFVLAAIAADFEGGGGIATLSLLLGEGCAVNRLSAVLNFVYCLLLFVAGVVFGFLFTKSGEIGFVAFLGAIASLATIGAAITAIYALNIWRPQFKHSEKFKALRKLREVMDSGNSSEEYIESVFFDCMRRNTNEVNSGTAVMDARHEAKIQWRRQCLDVERCWDDLETLFSKDELASFSDAPRNIDNFVESYVQELEYITVEGASVEFGQLHLQVSDACQSIRARTKQVSDDCKALISELVS